MAVVSTTVDLVFPGGSKRGTNSWHVLIPGTGAGDGSGLAAAMNAVKAFYTEYSGFVTSGYSFTWRGEGTSVGANPESAPVSPAWTVSGTGATDTGPAGVGMVVGWRTALANRSGRGRTFLAPLPSGQYETADGTLNQSILGTVRQAATVLVAASQAANDWNLVVYSTKTGSYRVFTGARVNDRVAYLSSRRI